MRTVVESARLRGQQIAVMQRSGIIDLKRPLRVRQKSSALKTLGPIASGITTGAQWHGDRIALVDREGALTYGQLDLLTNGIAHRWRALGLDETSVIGVMCRDHRGLVEAMVAAAKVGARLVLMNTGFSSRQFVDVAVRERVSAVVSDDEFTDMVAALPPDIARLSTAIPHSRGFENSDAAVSRPSRQGQFVLLTGGTTGTPKGAPREVASTFASAQFLDRVPLRSAQTVLLCAPLFHGTALSQFIIAVNLGCTIVLHGRFNAALALEQIESYRCDAVVLVPTMLRRMLDCPDINRRRTDSVSVIFTAGAALAPSLGDRALAHFGPVVYNYYGCTETGTATIATPEDWIAAPGTVGRPPLGITVALVDTDGKIVNSPGRKGTIHVGNTISFQGYSSGGSKSVAHGLMSTGDVGHWDSQGLLFVDGRDDDMIVSGGENVFPGEVEAALYAHPEITEAAVTGVPDEEFGQRLSAVIVRSNPDLDARAVRDYVRSELARFKVPRDVVFVDEIPRTTTGKIDRRAMAALTAEISLRTATGPPKGGFGNR
ncbi:AMP-binding protein [Hoyosella altamirensis]|uniref:Fatty-acyl-CoA synthase n=1 Tax=Hoyosella altamirensis TaxID=616997 RepID=A0A839RMN4_9ACTN|nr:AMP-binding protein [Hoyosella altamirensis]MBB3038202.1 fatty-acyl-CoA synthase [Hoyosella altamirensis]